MQRREIIGIVIASIGGAGVYVSVTGNNSGGAPPNATVNPTESPSDTPYTSTQTVTVGPGGSLRFDPTELTIATGTTVRWEWDSDAHSVTPDQTPSESGWQGTGTTTHDSGYVHEHRSMWLGHMTTTVNHIGRQE